MHYRIKKMKWSIYLIVLLGLFAGCKRGMSPTNPNVVHTNLSTVETNPYYMQCKDFLGLLQKAEAQVFTTEKIVILYSSGGSGHKSAAEAVARSLHDAEEQLLGKGRHYAIAQVDILYDLLPKEDLFDEYMKEEKWDKLKSLVAMQWLAEKMISARQLVWDNKVFNRIMRACDDRPPSMIISVFPVANYVYADIAKKYAIPLVIIPTDYEISHFINNIKVPKDEPAHVFMGLSLEEPEVTSPLYQEASSRPSIPYCIVGNPVREEFTKLRSKIDAAGPKKEAEEIKKYRRSVLKIPDNAKSILITLGGKGGALELITQYVSALYSMQGRSPLKNPLHVLIASGGDKNIIDGIKKQHSSFANNAFFKTHILGRLDGAHMALTMASVDAVLLKPGGSTVSEAIILGTPMLIKSDSTLALPWEKTNMLLVKRLGWGVELNPALERRVDTNDFIAKAKQILARTGRNQTPFINFQSKFPQFIDMIQRLSRSGETSVVNMCESLHQ